MKIILSKKFVKYFLISFLVYMALLLIQFMGRYPEDIFNKGFPVSDITRLLVYTLVTLLGTGLLFGFLMAAIFSFRYFSNNRVVEFKKELLSGSLVMVFVALVFFGFNNRILPKSTLEMRTLLYEMRATAPGEKIQRVDRNLFKDHYSMLTIKNINYKLDTFNTKIDEYEHQCDSVLALLPDSAATDNYDRLGLAEYGIKFNSSKADTMPQRAVRYAGYQLRSYQNNLKITTEQKQKYVMEKTTRIILPVVLLLLFIIGASFGFVYNDQKGFLLVILGLYTSLFFYQSERVISQNMFGNTWGTIFSMIVLITVTIIFLIKGLNKERKIT